MKVCYETGTPHFYNVHVHTRTHVRLLKVYYKTGTPHFYNVHVHTRTHVRLLKVYYKTGTPHFLHKNYIFCLYIVYMSQHDMVQSLFFFGGGKSMLKICPLNSISMTTCVTHVHVHVHVHVHTLLMVLLLVLGVLACGGPTSATRWHISRPCASGHPANVSLTMAVKCSSFPSENLGPTQHSMWYIYTLQGKCVYDNFVHKLCGLTFHAHPKLIKSTKKKKNNPENKTKQQLQR